jgi:hypothetical protein
MLQHNFIVATTPKQNKLSQTAALTRMWPTGRKTPRKNIEGVGGGIHLAGDIPQAQNTMSRAATPVELPPGT